MMNPIVGWLAEAVLVISLVLLAVAAGYGLLLLIAPARAAAFSAAMNRRISTRRSLRPLEMPRRTERAFYRHHRLAGGLLLLGTGLFFLLYFLDFPHGPVLAWLASWLGEAPADSLYQAAEWFLLAANAAIGVLGLIVLLRPSLLKPFESWANRWISTRQVFRGLERDHFPLDALAHRHPRLFGALILLSVIGITCGLWVAIL